MDGVGKQQGLTPKLKLFFRLAIFLVFMLGALNKASAYVNQSVFQWANLSQSSNTRNAFYH
ncbi:MAG: hypothetical protein OXE99_00350, partial [Cellvibrionales bacterium]|nr:hypothetical protein [Cellvibrionales bacterium]